MAVPQGQMQALELTAQQRSPFPRHRAGKASPLLQASVKAHPLRSSLSLLLASTSSFREGPCQPGRSGELSCQPVRSGGGLTCRAGTNPQAAVCAAAVTAGAPVAEKPLEIKDDGNFQWDAAWYPVAVIEDLNKRIPEAVTILGLPLVLWWDRIARDPQGEGVTEGGGRGATGEGEGGQWRVFHDLCPHRLAPLSEGRIHESGALQCSYHGWTFRGHDGACTMIPQAPKDGPPVNSSPKACARPYPSRQHQGILWVWAQPQSPASLALSEATPLPVVPAVDDPAFSFNMGQQDLGYGQEMLLENLLDPAHVNFAHHNVNNQGKRENAMPLDFFVRELGKWGFRAEGLEYAKATFVAPCTIMMEANVVDLVAARKRLKQSQAEAQQPHSNGGTNGASHRGAEAEAAASSTATESATESAAEAAAGAAPDTRQIQFAFHCIPRSPGFSRVIFMFAFNFLPPVARSIPRWFVHLGQMLVLDSDHYLLHLTERRLLEEGGSDKALSVYFTPTRSDSLVCAYRRWLKERGGGGVKWPEFVDPALPAPLPKRQLMDRQQNHVKMCRSCQKAQKGFEILQMALQVAAFVSLAALILKNALRPHTTRVVTSLVTVLFSSLCAGASVLLSRFISKNYYFHDYLHALVD